MKESDPSLETNMEFGVTLLRSGKILNKQAKDDIQNEIDAFLQRRSHLAEVTGAEKNK